MSFLLKKIVANVKKRRQQLHGGDHGDCLTELRVHAMKGIDHQGWGGQHHGGDQRAASADRSSR
jgi:hypothetical protein